MQKGHWFFSLFSGGSKTLETGSSSSKQRRRGLGKRRWGLYGFLVLAGAGTAWFFVHRKRKAIEAGAASEGGKESGGFFEGVGAWFSKRVESLKNLASKGPSGSASVSGSASASAGSSAGAVSAAVKPSLAK